MLKDREVLNMRCKNCGTDNDDNRYICETCGSPLYDEEDIAVNSEDNQRTQTFAAVQESGANRHSNGVQNQSSQNNFNNGKYNNTNMPNNQNNDSEQKNSDKKNIVTIGILVVILIAIIASVVAISHNKNDVAKNEEDSSLTRISSTVEKTSEEATEETTEKTTEKTTVTKWIINTSSSGGGKTEGDGKYKNGERVVLIAKADDGYEFDGWYSDGIKVSNEKKYVFNANENASFSAVFNPIETEPITEAPIEPTSVEQTPEVVFGE